MGHTFYRFPGLKKLSFCFEKGLSLCVPTVRVFCYLLYLSACLLCLWFLYSYLSVMVNKYCLSLNSLTGRESETNQDS